MGRCSPNARWCWSLTVPWTPASLEAGLVISPTVTGRYEWESPERVAYYPDGGWSSSDLWEARLGSEVRAADGGALEPVTLHFSLDGRGSPLPVLMYHHVDELGPDATEGKKDWTVSPAAFREQMAVSGAGRLDQHLGHVRWRTTCWTASRCRRARS